MQIEADSLLDGRRVGALQIRVFVFCALVALLDAVDSQAIGVAGPLMSASLKMSAAAFSPAYSAGLLGAAIGALAFGPVSDRFGRKPALVFTTLLFGIFTVLTAAATSDRDNPPLRKGTTLRPADHVHPELVVEQLRRRGRPRVEFPKRQVTLRLDGDVIDGVRATGPGWQGRVNDVLRHWLERQRRDAR